VRAMRCSRRCNKDSVLCVQILQGEGAMRAHPWPAYYHPPAPKYVRRNRVRADIIIREVCMLTELSVSDFMGPRKYDINSTARQAAVYVLHRRRPDLSWRQMARMVGRSDHSTAIHAYQAACVKVVKEPEFALLVMKLEAVG
jgi:chromosomal replication initiation ATPase DnaA